MFNRENQGEPSSVKYRRCTRTGYFSIPALVLTALTAGILIFCNSGASTNDINSAAGDQPVAASQSTPIEKQDNLDKETFYYTRVGSLLNVSATDISVMLSGEVHIEEVGTAEVQIKEVQIKETQPEAAQPEKIKTEAPQLYIEGFAANPKVPLSDELQAYLYEMCTERNLDYFTALAVIKHESGFNPNALGGGCNYGLFQINSCNHKTLSRVLGTENDPYDPVTNINWGTHMLSSLYAKYAGKYSGEELTKAVLSAYNMGEGGFAKYGYATGYINTFYKNLAVVESWFADSDADAPA